MKALVYHGADQEGWETSPIRASRSDRRDRPRRQRRRSAGRDLHILKGDVPEVPGHGPRP